MPRRTDISKILVLGAGPIKIGQACEFDYSGTQACAALKQLGYEVVLVNSNPATIMTDPERAARTYVEPLNAFVVQKVIAKERPHALLPTMGGQTALNIAAQLAEAGVLAQYKVELIGASLESIKVAEDRALFRSKMIEIGLPVPQSQIIRSMSELKNTVQKIGLPAIVRPAYTLGGTGSGIARSETELFKTVEAGLKASPVHEVLVEESVIGWKEIELEVVRDRADNFIVVCSIENLDPMGVHTGDSITVAPLQTIADKEYQILRDAARKIISAIGIDCGGSNIQFAISPETGDFVVIEMNPRVSRSSALASKATGYPIAKVAAKLAVGLTLDEIRNEIAGDTSACFEPTLDYVVTKIPRFDFDKFYGSAGVLGTEMKSVGEVMAVGSTFQESMQKALRGLELGLTGFSEVPNRKSDDAQLWKERLQTPSRFRLMDIWGAFTQGLTIEEIANVSGIDPWFLENLRDLFDIDAQAMTELSQAVEGKSKKAILGGITREFLQELKMRGLSDGWLAQSLNTIAGDVIISEDDIFELRKRYELFPAYRVIDTCAAEFPSESRYLYSTYHSETSEREPKPARKIIILGSGPNRIGQGIEFDYCCVQASMTIKDLGAKPIMINCNPETVSTDYDVSDVLYFEPVTLEEVSNIALFEQADGIIVQMGGQTPLKLARKLEARGFKLLGTTCDATDLAEDRARFRDVLKDLGLKQPAGGMAHNLEEARAIARELGYPVLVRPSYVLGGKRMRVVYSAEQLETSFGREISLANPVLVDQFLEGAVEIDVDALSDGKQTVIAGIMEQIEAAGVHSGDSSCVLPPQNLSRHLTSQIELATKAIARALHVVGFLNVQFALKDGVLYVLEANPRASRTIPFVSKAMGVPWVKIATRVIMGESLSSLTHLWKEMPESHVAVKSVVIPFSRFPEAQVSLGPEMRSTGEVMGLGQDFGTAYANAQWAADQNIPQGGRVLVSASEESTGDALKVIQHFSGLGFEICITPPLLSSGLRGNNKTIVLKVDGGDHELSAQMRQHDVKLVVSLTPIDLTNDTEQTVRLAALKSHTALFISYKSAEAACQAIAATRINKPPVRSLQEYNQAQQIPFQVISNGVLG